MFGSYTLDYPNSESRTWIKDENFVSRLETLIEKANNSENHKDCLSVLQNLLSICKKSDFTLSQNQIRQIQKIESHFSPQNIEMYNNWIKSFDDEKRNILNICVEYYKTTKYKFEGVINKIINDPNFIPTEQQYNSIVKNKYAKKVIKATLDKPKFEKNQLVQIKKEAFKNTKPFSNIGFIMQANSSPVKNPMKGAKNYKILLLGEANAFEVEERFIRPHKK